ncbi:MAG: hypothetical protein ABI721_01975 [Candidatus Dojkabacteria bacterium]
MNEGLFKQLNKGHLLRDKSHKPTNEIIDRLKNKIDALKGDAELEDIGADGQPVDLNTINITDPNDIAEIDHNIEELRYIMEELQRFIESGSREKLLKYFTEDQLENPDFFKEALDQINQFLRFSNEVRESLQNNATMSLGRVYSTVLNFQSTLGTLTKDSHGDESLINEIITGKDYLKNRNEVNALTEIKKITEDISNFSDKIYEKLFLGINRESTIVGEDTYNTLLPYIPGLKERVQFILNLTSEDLTFLNISDKEKEESLNSIKREAEVALEYIEIIENPENKQDLISQNKHASTIRGLMVITSSNGLKAGLANRLYALILREE